MIRNSILVALAGLALPLPLQAVDLTKVDRRIHKEPSYQTNTPKYCLLVFGPQASTRVWLVLDGNAMYIDRNANGDLTESGERVMPVGTHQSSRSTNFSFSLGDVRERDGSAVHRRLFVSEYGDVCGISINSHRRGRQFVGFRDEEKTAFAAKPSDAPIIHFDGPLVMAQYGKDRVLPRSGSSRARSLRVMIGTPGLGKGTFAACVCTCRRKFGTLNVKFTFPLDAQGKDQWVRRLDVRTFN